ncbi:SDR family NAD(P)-dependent oxidoreductase [Aeromicrobium duanguangcaii]|uniref:SDR family oxidoreductase n=1 Tax=Aeromicrobium duanguangcaii TaxID=2968086 RepID=A0ABY5KH24_9ACTN|nr:SDR family oxidoreductase [Aeromicrobium duanguangcaii]MCD9153137.1 SDR family oxidoreductase [Aeromicrobium duanguangcaii]UUI69762.1 SDR family oxidoreductase [Aeromicrobium duanguangcaii]
MTATPELNGQCIVVTGASRGIGRAISLTLAAAGAHVVLGARSEPAAQTVANEIESHGGRAVAVRADITSQVDTEQLAAAAVEAFGRIDVLVANAGMESSATLMKSDPSEWIATVTTNLVGSYLSARAVLPQMKEQGSGQVLFVGSGMGHSKAFGRSAYGASKAGLSHLAGVLSQEMWRYGINVNELVPGPVATDMTRGRWTLGEVPAELPSERVKPAVEVAEFVRSILCLGAGGPTGQVFSLARRPL